MAAWSSFVIAVLPLLVIILVFIFVIGIVRRVDRRAEERLKLEKEHIALQQKQMEEINNRLTKIEEILKEVD